MKKPPLVRTVVGRLHTWKARQTHRC
jgi:hypothetical protein